MAILSPKLDANDPALAANAAEWAALRAGLLARRGAAAEGGSAKARERHVSRGKLLPRDRVRRLLD
ncbi:MAG: methylcrotonoyl-CoA carboxylase, partial [Beijerinckiaceae bacterium]